MHTLVVGDVLAWVFNMPRPRLPVQFWILLITLAVLSVALVMAIRLAV